MMYQNQKDVVRFACNSSLVKFDTIDAMFKRVYDQEKLNFSLKCKFYYKKATATKDTANLRQFVDDCDYYQEDKDWCYGGLA